MICSHADCFHRSASNDFRSLLSAALALGGHASSLPRSVPGCRFAGMDRSLWNSFHPHRRQSGAHVHRPLHFPRARNACAFRCTQRFVALGPYKIIRNPMYLAGLALLIGLGLYQHSKVILLFCPVWFLLAHTFVMLYEEPTLMNKFGTTYQGYCRAVPRWIPKW